MRRHGGLWILKDGEEKIKEGRKDLQGRKRRTEKQNICSRSFLLAHGSSRINLDQVGGGTGDGEDEEER